MSSLTTGCGSVWLERSVRDAEAARSNRAIPTIKKQTGSSEAGARFFYAASGMCPLPCTACAREGGRRVRLSAQRGPVFLNCRDRWDQVAGQFVFQGEQAFSRADSVPGFCGNIRQLACVVRRCSYGGRKCGERGLVCYVVPSKAGRPIRAAA